MIDFKSRQFEKKPYLCIELQRGGRVKKDTLLGIVTDPYGEIESQITTPYSESTYISALNKRGSSLLKYADIIKNIFSVHLRVCSKLSLFY